MKRVLVHTVRIAVCVAALWWALRGLSWHDRVHLRDGRRLTLLAVRADGAVEVLDPSVGPVLVEGAEVPRDAEGDLVIDYGVPTVWRRSEKRLLLLSLVLFAPVPLIAAVRFIGMLRAQDIRLSLWDGIKLTYAGNFFNFFVFGTTGGDLFKAYYAAQHTPRKVEAVTAVLLDRVVGLFGLILLSIVGMLVRLEDQRVRRLLLWVVVLLAGLTAGLIVFYLPGLRRRLRPWERLRGVPGIDKLRRIDSAILRMREHPAIVAGAFLCTFVLQGIAVGSFYLWGPAMGMRRDWASYYAYIGIALLVAAVPVSPMGLGTMESALMLFLRGPFGTKSQVLFLALGIRLTMLAWALPGVLVPLTGAHRPSARALADLEADIRTEEASAAEPPSA